jgi:HAMP domain-containing protein
MLTIRKKLHLGFGLILAFMLGQTVVTFLSISQSEALVTQAIDKDFNASVEIAAIGIEAQKLRRFEKEYLIYVGSPSAREKYYAEWKSAHDQIKTKVDAIVDNRDGKWSPEDVVKARDWRSSLQAYFDGFATVVRSVNGGQITSTLQGNDAVREAKDAFRVLVDGAAQGYVQKFQQAHKSGENISNRFRLVNIVLGISALAGIGLVAVALMVLPASVSHPIEVLTRSAHEMSTGKLDHPVAIEGSPEFKDLADTLERMRISMQMLIERARK